MAPKTVAEEYAELMERNGEGHYLYKPQRYSDLHPGVIGYFGKYGAWNKITDLSVEGQPERDGFTALSKQLKFDTPTEGMWKTRSSGSEAEASFGLNAGLSGALTAAPVDVSANANNKVGSNGKAALITSSVVKNEKFKAPCGPPIERWVKANAKALVNSDWGDAIKMYGLWAIQTTWSTRECAITMTSGHNRDTSGGFDVGGTGVGKVGASGSAMKKLESEGWSTYEATEDDQGLVISYGGAGYRLHTIQKFRSNPLKQTEKVMADEVEYCKTIYDENGNAIGQEFYRRVYDEDGNEIGEEKIDREVEKKKREEEEAKESTEVEEDFVIEACGPVGLSESDIEADKKRAQEEEEEDRKNFSKKVASLVAQYPDETERRVHLAKLLAENSTEVTYTTPV